MNWTLANNPVGDLEYNYYADGHVIEKTGSFAQTNLPQPLSGNTFNADNEMTAFNGTALTYDTNGNLTNDSTKTYTYCFGLTTEGNWLDAPGEFEPDKLNNSCKLQSRKSCVDSCLLGVAEGDPPKCSLGNGFGGMNCEKFANWAVANCQAQCAGASGSAP